MCVQFPILLVLQVNFTSELCAGKLTIEGSPQRWSGTLETSSDNQNNFNFTLDSQKPADNKAKRFYGGTEHFKMTRFFHFYSTYIFSKI